MHELAITESIVEQISERVGNARVTRVVLEIGAFSGVMPDALRFCFDLCAESTALKGAALEIMEIPGLAHCRTCENEIHLDEPFALCRCGSADLVFLKGRELRIKGVELIDV
ncbi:MAG: hydrogenase maturation nickel metallochaperone HypA [Candidatus Binataceae bacterium]